MCQCDVKFDLFINVGHIDKYFMVLWICLTSWRLLMDEHYTVCDRTFDLKINQHGHYFMVQWLCPIPWWMNIMLWNYESVCKAQPRGRFGRNILPKLADFSLCWAEGEVKMYRTYREIQNLDQNFSLKSWKCRKTSPCLKAPGWPLSVTQRLTSL